MSKRKTPEIQEDLDLKAVLGTAEGRRLMWRILGHCQVNNTIGVDTHADMAFAAGRQSVGYWIQAEMIAVKPRSYIEMMGERVTEEAAEAVLQNREDEKEDGDA